MLERLISLASYGVYGEGIGDVLNKMEQAGFFRYVLPFLLIFAIVFAVLTQIKIFKDNKGVNAIIALVVGLMALQFDMVPIFFAEIFPRVGVGLSILLAMIIFLGLFAPDKDWMTYVFFGIAVIIFIAIVVKSTAIMGFYEGGGYIWDQYGSIIIILIVLLVFIATIMGASNPKESSTSSGFTRLLKSMGD